jgi:uncharacterized protein (DUF111 family)
LGAGTQDLEIPNILRVWMGEGMEEIGAESKKKLN